MKAPIPSFLKPLSNKLIPLGGKGIVLTGDLEEEPTAKDTIQFGKEFSATHVSIRKRIEGQCHANIASLKEARPRIKIAVGWALDKHGNWFLHSWGYDPKTKQTIETTFPRKKYIGRLLEKDEEQEFVEANKW